MNRIEHLIQSLGLQKHPEGGWYKEVYRSAESISLAGLPKRFDGERSFCTSIYFLLSGDEFSGTVSVEFKSGVFFQFSYEM